MGEVGGGLWKIIGEKVEEGYGGLLEIMGEEGWRL